MLLPTHPTGQRGSRKEEEGQEGGWDHVVENSESQAKGLASLELLKQEHGVIRAQCQGDQPGVGGGGRGAEAPRPDVRPGSRVAKELTLQDQTASIQTQVPPRVSGDLW